MKESDSGINHNINGEIEKPTDTDFREILDQAKLESEKDKIDFHEAKSLAELYEMIRKKGKIMTTNGTEEDAETVITAIAAGHLEAVTRNDDLREIAKNFLIQEEFRFAFNMEDVFNELRRRGEIKGSKRTYTAEEIIEFINQRRIEEIPRTDGLRLTIKELLKSDKEDNSERNNINN